MKNFLYYNQLFNKIKNVITIFKADSKTLKKLYINSFLLKSFPNSIIKIHKNYHAFCFQFIYDGFLYRSYQKFLAFAHWSHLELPVAQRNSGLNVLINFENLKWKYQIRLP